ncbi:MAG: ATP-dependent metallopeptidase FtsH/Yme1/Tma family protein [Proteobacteria bacterium]|nr:ATP-dependent metallopeptidase FtsH/Yme1/Tma family protein [Pseudomonadota bacterium]
MVNNLRNLALWIIIAVALVFLFNLFVGQGTHPQPRLINYTEFVQKVVQGEVKEVTIDRDQITGRLSNAEQFSTNAPSDPQLVPRLIDHNVLVTSKPSEDGFNLMAILLNAFPMLLLIAVWIFFMRQLQSGGGKAMGFGKSRAKLLTERTGRVTFEDVAGVDEAKDDLKEIVDFLRDPQKFQRLGGRIPKGVLLVGPPGTGKTLLARAIAGEANVPFFTISGSDFVEMFVGVGASRVRDMFEQAKKNAPCIVFIDEIDAVGRHRGAGLGGGNDEREQTLNQLLVEMDGFEANDGVILIAATNRPDVLDPALLRPGRFDRNIVVPNPDLGGREKILRVHMRKVPLAPDVDPRVLARGTPGFSGADLANLVNEAALLAARRGKRVVMMSEMEDAKDKVMMGAERRSMAMTEEEKKLTAYHEAGHALVGIYMPQHDPLHKVTIIPRGRALGLTLNLPEQDRTNYTRQYCVSKLASMFGGREAEVLIFGPDNVTTGASSDIQQATRMARSMVMEWGMSEKLGRVRYRSNEQEVFLGHSVAQTTNLSEETAKLIDDEVRKLIEDGEQTARRILTEHRDQLDMVAQGLLEYETLSGDEVTGLLKGIRPVRTPYEEPEPQRGPGPSVPAAGRPRGGIPIAPEPQPGH